MHVFAKHAGLLQLKGPIQNEISDLFNDVPKLRSLYQDAHVHSNSYGLLDSNFVLGTVWNGIAALSPVSNPKSDSKNGTAGFVSTIMPEVTVNELKPQDRGWGQNVAWL
jgi:hypothetical protein